ncbi:MAG: 50S ribosomal protein L15 [Patescibacteria group bacterium]
MELHQLEKVVKKKSKRLGRGVGSGKGKTAGRGTKGQKSRSGYNLPRRFEGGQMPWIQRISKLKGFKSRHPKAQIVKISQIEAKFKEGERVDLKSLIEKGLIKTKDLPVKILADKKLEKGYLWREVKLSQKILKVKVAEEAKKDIKPFIPAKPVKTHSVKISKNNLQKK